MLTKNKKGNGFVAWFFVLVVLLAFSIFMLVINKAWGEIETPLAASLEKNMPNNTDVNVTDILHKVGNTERNLSNMLPFLIIGLFAFVLIGAGSLMKHPIMIFVGIVILAVCILLAVVFSNVYTQMSDTPKFEDTKNELLIQNKFMDYLPTIIFIMAIGIFIAVLYGKSQGATGI